MCKLLYTSSNSKIGVRQGSFLDLHQAKLAQKMQNIIYEWFATEIDTTEDQKNEKTILCGVDLCGKILKHSLLIKSIDVTTPLGS